ncbi:MAG: YfhO family protein [Candidatus Edwardsbacteria bacterium]
MTKKRRKEKQRKRLENLEEKEPKFFPKSWFFILLLLVLSLLLFLPYLTGAKMLFGTDWLSGGYSGRRLTAELTKEFHQLPMWNPYVYSGQPTVAGFAADFFYPTALFRLFIPTHIVWTYTFIIHLFLAGLGTYLFLKELKLGLLPSFFGAIAYMFTGFLVSHTYAGHDGKLICECLFPLMLFFLHKGLTKGKFRYFIFAGAMLGLSLHSGHLQSAYYSGLVSFVYFLFYLWQKRKEKKTFKLILSYGLMIVIMVGIVAIYYFPIYANLKYGARGEAKGYTYAVSWSMPLVEIFDLITPDFVGVLDNYWGPNYFKLHLRYLGILPLILAIIAIFYKWKESKVKFVSFLGLFALLMALGGSTPFYRIPYYLLPGVKMFRSPDLIFFVFAFCLSVLAAFGLEFLIGGFSPKTSEKEKKKLNSWLIFFTIGFFCLLLIFIVAKDGIINILTNHYEPLFRSLYGEGGAGEKMQNLLNNYPTFLNGFAKASLLVLINVILLLLLLSKKLNLRLFTVITIPLLLFDLWSFDLKFIKPHPRPDIAFVPDEVANFLEKDKVGALNLTPVLYRVFPMHYQNYELALRYRMQSAGGHLANPLQRYQDFIGAEKSVMFQAPNLMSKNFLNLLNVKYIISLPLPEDTTRYDERSRGIIRNLKAFFKDFPLAFQGREFAIYENENYLPRAFIVPNYEVIPETKRLIMRLKEPDFDPHKSVLLEEEPAVKLSGEATGLAEVEKFSPNEILIKANLSASGFLVLSENFHPDWKAYLDQKRVKIYPAYHTLRAIYLEGGTHKVRFVYDSIYYRIGKAVTIITLLILVAAFLRTLRPSKQLRKMEQPQ